MPVITAGEEYYASDSRIAFRYTDWQMMNSSSSPTGGTKMSKNNTQVKVATVDLTKYASLPTKSAKIRAMFADGIKKTLIAKTLDIRYQHVRNVLITPLKKI